MDGGVNKSGTFNYICRECDAKFFQDYENPDNIIHPPTDKFLAEIAVKNMLLQLSKRANEQELIPVLQRELGMYENPDDLSKIKTLDQKEYEEEVLFHQDIAKNNKVGGYQILFWKVLPYKVPIATQSAIVLPYDMEGNILNEIYNFDESVRMQYMHIAVLGFSVIRENYRPERNDWKSDLQCGNIELEIFGVSNPPARVSHPEAAKM